MSEILWCAKRGDLAGIDREVASGVAIDTVMEGDYLRTGWDAMCFGADSRDCSKEAFEGILHRMVNADALRPLQLAEALHKAARGGALSKVKALLAVGANPGGKTLLGSEVLNTVSYYKSPEHLMCLRALLEAQSGDKISAETLAVSFREAVGWGNQEAIDHLKEFADESVFAALAKRTHECDARFLIGSRSQAIQEVEPVNLQKLLETAVALDDLDAVHALVARGADLSALDKLGDALLCIAAAADAQRVTRWLIQQGADPNFSGYAGWTPLFQAVTHGAARTTRLLLKAGASFEFTEGPGEPSSVIPDAMGPAIPVLLEFGADLDTIGPDGYWLLKHAAELGDVALARDLLDWGATVDRHQELIEETALHTAVSNEEAAVVALLLERGADPNIEDLDGYRALNFARSQFVREMLLKAGAIPGSAQR